MKEVIPLRIDSIYLLYYIYIYTIYIYFSQHNYIIKAWVFLLYSCVD